MQIRITITKEELQSLQPLSQKIYENRDGTFRLYFNNIDDFKQVILGEE